MPDVQQLAIELLANDEVSFMWQEYKIELFLNSSDQWEYSIYDEQGEETGEPLDGGVFTGTISPDYVIEQVLEHIER